MEVKTLRAKAAAYRRRAEAAQDGAVKDSLLLLAEVYAEEANKRERSQKQKAREAAHMFAADHDEVAFEKSLENIEEAKPKRLPKKVRKPKSRR
jgi:hypothetical protein